MFLFFEVTNAFPTPIMMEITCALVNLLYIHKTTV